MAKWLTAILTAGTVAAACDAAQLHGAIEHRIHRARRIALPAQVLAPIRPLRRRQHCEVVEVVDGQILESRAPAQKLWFYTHLTRLVMLLEYRFR